MPNKPVSGQDPLDMERSARLLQAYAAILGRELSLSRADQGVPSWTETSCSIALTVTSLYEVYTQVEYALAHMMYGVPSFTIESFSTVGESDVTRRKLIALCAYFLEDMRVRSLWALTYPGSAEMIEEFSQTIHVQDMLYQAYYGAEGKGAWYAGVRGHILRAVEDVQERSHAAVYPAARRLAETLLSLERQQGHLLPLQHILSLQSTTPPYSNGRDYVLPRDERDFIYKVVYGEDCDEEQCKAWASFHVQTHTENLTDRLDKQDVVEWRTVPARSKRATRSRLVDMQRVQASLSTRHIRMRRALDEEGLAVDTGAYIESRRTQETRVWEASRRRKRMAVTLLVDESTSVSTWQPNLEQAAAELSAAVRGSDGSLRIVGFTRHDTLAMTVLREHDPAFPRLEASGGTPLLGAFRHLVSSYLREGRKDLLVLLTDSEDNDWKANHKELRRTRLRAEAAGLAVVAVVYRDKTSVLSHTELRDVWGPRTILVPVDKAVRAVSRIVWHRVLRG